MHIIIVGAGEAGHYLAQILIEENHDVCVIEQDEKRARQLDEKLDAQVIHGTGTSRESLFRAGIHKADLLAAVTQVDEVNLIAAMTAERLKPGCRTVARVREVRYMEGTDALDASEFGVDMVVGPEQAVADQIVNLLQYGGPGQMVSVADGKMALLELPVSPHSAFVYATAAELAAELPSQSRLVAILGDAGLRIAGPEDRFEIGERVVALCVPGQINRFLTLAGSDDQHIERVLLIGGGTIGYHVARQLQRLKFHVTVVERSPEKAEKIAAKLNRCTVIQGDGTEPAMLADQMRDGQDAVVVLLDQDEESLLCGIMAKHLGAKKVISRVDKREYGPIAHKLGVDALISPRRAVADAILRFVRRGHITATVMLGDHQGELIDFVLEKKIKKELLSTNVTELKLPAGAVIGCILRGAEVIIPTPECGPLETGDHVFVVAVRGAVPELEGLFG